MAFTAVPAEQIELLHEVLTGDVIVPAFSRRSFLKGTGGGLLRNAPPVTFVANIQAIDAPVRNYDLVTFAGLGLGIETTIVAGNRPAVASRDLQSFDAVATTHDYVYPLTRRLGQLLIMAVATSALTTITTPTDWDLVQTQAGTDSRTAVYSKVVDGLEPEELQLTFGTASAALVRTWMVDIGDGPVEAVAGLNDSAAGTSLDLGAISPTWAVDEPTNNLYIAILGLADEAAVSGFPAGFSPTGQDALAGECTLAYAERSALGSSEDPGAFTYAASRATAHVIAIKPKLSVRMNWDGLTVRKNDVLVGTQRVLNIIEGTGITATITNNAVTGAVDVELESSGGGGGTPSWADTLEVSKFSGPWNPHIDSPQYLSFGVEDVIPSVGDIRASGDMHIEANGDGFFHVLGDLFLGGHASPNDSTTIVSDIITLDATDNLIGLSDDIMSFTSVNAATFASTAATAAITGQTGATITATTGNAGITATAGIAAVFGGTQTQLLSNSDVIVGATDDFRVFTGSPLVQRLEIDQAGAWLLGVGTLPGISGQVLTSQGSGTPPIWATVVLASLVQLPDIADDTFLANISGSLGPPTAVPLSTLAGNGLTGGANAVLNVGGSTSIIVGANDVQRAALTGEVTAGQNVNSTVIARTTNFTWTGQHVWEHASADFWMSTNGGGIELNTLNSGHPVGVPNGDIVLVSQGETLIDADTFTVITNSIERLEIEPDGAWQLGGDTGAAGEVLTSQGASSPPIWGAAPTGSIGIQQNSGTLTTGIQTLNFINGTRSTAAAVPVGTAALITFNVDVPAMASTSIINSSNTLQRAALTGEVTAPQNNNTTAIVRSTNFNWTGQHTFSTSGVFDVTAASDVNINGQGGAVFGSSASPISDATVGSVHIFADGLFRIFTNNVERLEIESDGAWQVDSSTGTSGQVLTSNGNSASPSWQTIGTVGPLTYTSINATLSSDVSDWAPTGFAGATWIRITASSFSRTINSIAGGTHGRVIVLVNIGSNPVVVANNGAGTASNRIIHNMDSPNMAENETMTLVYDGTTSRWRVIAFAGSLNV